MKKFVLPAMLFISTTYTSACELTPSTPSQISYRQDAGSIASMFADCIVSVANGAAMGRPDLTGIRAVNPLNDHQILFVATKDGVAVSAYYVLVSDSPGASQGTGWLGVDGDDKHPDGRVFN